MQTNRGFHFLIGIAVVWIFWRLLITGVFHDLGFLAFQQDQAFRGPGAIFIAFLIEAVIAVGAVAVLIVTGLWQATYQAGVLIQDAFRMLVEYLSEWQKNRDTPAAPSDDKPKQPEQPIDSTPANPIVGAIIDTREQMQRQQILIERLAAQLDSLQQPPAAEAVE